MILSRTQFFLLLLLIMVAPFALYKLWWIYTSEKSTGIVQFTGHGNLGSVLGISTYPVIKFAAGRDSVLFNGNIDLGLKENDRVAVRYQPGNRSDAKMNTLVALWGDTLAYSMGPLMVFLAVFLMPDIFPRHARIRIGGRPFFQLL